MTIETKINIPMKTPIKILALSGSLRQASINSALLRAATQLELPEIEMRLCDLIGHLPLFNPDLETNLPGIVQDLRAQVSIADVLLIASPEYAHGVSGVLKNALDWLVSLQGFANKPVVLWNAAPRAHHADDALREILRTMSAALIEPASITIPCLLQYLSAQEILLVPEITAAMSASLKRVIDILKMRHMDDGFDVST